MEPDPMKINAADTPRLIEMSLLELGYDDPQANVEIGANRRLTNATTLTTWSLGRRASASSATGRAWRSG